METVMTVLLTEEQAAERLHVQTSTLQAWRVSGQGPKFVKVGRLVRYAEVDIESYIEARRVTSTNEAVTKLM